MKREPVKLTIFLLCLLQWMACEYKPTGTNYVNVDASLPTGLSLNLSTPGDTLRITGDVILFFRNELYGHDILNTECYMDSTLISNGKQADYVEFRSNQYEDGYHVFTARFIVTSETGSLADRYDAEGFLLEKSWIMRISNPIHQPIKIESILPLDGSLALSWTRCSHFFFERYILIRNYFEIAEITDRNQTVWIDEDFVGGPATYRLMVFADGREPASSPLFYFYAPYARFVCAAITPDYKLHLRWSKCLFEKNLVQYKLAMMRTDGGFDTIKDISQARDTSYVFSDVRFGKLYYLRLVAKAKTQESVNDTTACLGTRIYPFHSISYAPGQSCYFARTLLQDARAYSRIRRLDAEDLHIIATQTIPPPADGPIPYWSLQDFTISPSGQYVYASFHNCIHELNPNDLSIRRSLSVQQLLNGADAAPDHMQVSDDNQLAFWAYDVVGPHDQPEYGGRKLVLVDMNNLKMRDTRPATNTSAQLLLSANGKYCFANDTLYSCESTKLTPICGTDTSLVFLDQGDQYITARDDEVAVHDSRSGRIVRRLAIGARLSYLNYDSISRILAGYSEDDEEYRFINIETGQSVKNIHVVPIQAGRRYFYANSKLISNDGFFLPVAP